MTQGFPDTPVVTDNGPRRAKGRNPPKHFSPGRIFAEQSRLVSATSLGSGIGSDIVGCWDFFPALGGNWFQLSVGRCFGASTAKAVSCYQLGQTGIPIRFSMDWCYTGALTEIRRVELGGFPTLAELLANPLTDTGSEPAAGWNRFAHVGFAPTSSYPDGTGFSAREYDMGSELLASNYKPLALGQHQIVARPGPDLVAAGLAALSPFKDGKRGATIQLSLATGTQAFEYADGSRVLTRSDFNGSNYDHAPTVVGAFPADLLRGVRPTALPASLTGNLFVVSNHWLDFGDQTIVPELDASGAPTGKWIPMPGAILIDESAFNAATDWSSISEGS